MPASGLRWGLSRVSYARLTQPVSQILPIEIKNKIQETKNPNQQCTSRSSSKDNLVEVLALLAKQDLTGSFNHPQHFTPSLAEGQGKQGQDHEPTRRQRQVRLGKSEVASLVGMYKSGASVLALAKAFGVHRTTVTAHLDRHEVARRPNSRRLSDVDVDVRKAAGQYSTDKSLATVARRHNVDAATIAREFSKADVQIRRRLGWVGDGNEGAREQ